MNGLRALVLASLVALPAFAAEVTRIASSFDEDQPFGMFIDLSFERTQERGLITRQWHQNNQLVNVNELRYTGVDSRLAVDAHIGIWHDLEISYGLPLILAQTENWGYAGATNAGNSTITNNCLNPDGTLTDPNCPTAGTGAVPMFPVPNNSYRGGLGNMRFGTAWAAFNQKRDDTKPTWILAFDYEAPTATQLDPSVTTTSTSRGAIGDREHKYTFSTALSRRYGFIEPYFRASYMFPFPGPGYYSNCANPNPASMSAPGNCQQGPWTKWQSRIREPNVVTAEFGSELNLMDTSDTHQRIALDLRGITRYVSSGRYYNEMSYLFGKLLQTQDYMQLGGDFSVIAQAADYVSFKATAEMLYATDHDLSVDSPGLDLNGDGVIDTSPGSLEANPNFDYRADPAGRRFRISQDITFRVDVLATFIF